jgi:hypothetical protein
MDRLKATTVLLHAAILGTAAVLPAADASAESTKPAINLTIADRANVEAPAVRTAVAVASQLFRAIGVDLRWPGEDAGGPPSMQVTIVLTVWAGSWPIDHGKRSRNPVLGLSLVNCRRVYVFADRVRQLSRSTAQEFPVVLGRVLAHEIGHQVLPPGHAQTGIMQASLEYLQGFSKAEGVTIRAFLAGGQ